MTADHRLQGPSAWPSPAASRSSSSRQATHTALIGPMAPHRFEAEAIVDAIAVNPLVESASNTPLVYSVVTNCTYDGMDYGAEGVEARLSRTVDRFTATRRVDVYA